MQPPRKPIGISNLRNFDIWILQYFWNLRRKTNLMSFSQKVIYFGNYMDYRGSHSWTIQDFQGAKKTCKSINRKLLMAILNVFKFWNYFL